MYATGASAIGVPGCPELAFWIASIESVRIVLMQRWSMSEALACAKPLSTTPLPGVSGPSQDEEKRAAAQQAADLVEDGMAVGLGTAVERL